MMHRINEIHDCPVFITTLTGYPLVPNLILHPFLHLHRSYISTGMRWGLCNLCGLNLPERASFNLAMRRDALRLSELSASNPHLFTSADKRGNRCRSTWAEPSFAPRCAEISPSTHFVFALWNLKSLFFLLDLLQQINAHLDV
ncbi:hypothetical protein GOODEAATRI_015292 [Goodea atripinnis]|uniref:Uncharacterized protein n=1 Tax=Goodea atripinnis TaxID=208336 RepID=A0ABV0NMY8_9TELE